MHHLGDKKLEKSPAMNNIDFFEYSILIFVGVFLTTLFGLWWFQPSHVPNNFLHSPLRVVDYILFIAVTYVVWYHIINELFSWLIASNIKHPIHMIPPQQGLKVAMLTAFVPGKEPYDVLENTLSAMVNVKYPHDTWLLDEGNDAETKRLCKLYGVRHFSRAGKKEYNQVSGPYTAKTKAGNYNSWFHLKSNKYDIVAQHDVDFVPHEDFLIKTLGYFKDPAVAFVGTPQVYGNVNDSWIARGAAEQAYGFYGHMQKGLFGFDMSLFIGANHVIRVAAHDDIEGYSGHIVEDHLTGMKIYAKKWKSVYLPEILAIGEGPATWEAYFSQQMRWAYGLIDILFRHSPSLFKKMKLRHAMNYFLLQQYYFYGIAQAIGITLITLYFIFGIQSTAMALLPLLALYVSLIIVQQAIFLFLQQYNIDPKAESGLMLRAKLLNVAVWPIYFLAFLGVLRGKRLVYAVTPKGKQQAVDDVRLSLFTIHFILGSITLLDIIVSYIKHDQPPLLFFWALVNTLFMYYFFFSIALKKFFAWLNSEIFQKQIYW